MTLTRTTDAPRFARRPRRTLAQVLVAVLSLAALVAGALLSVTRVSALYQDIAETGSPGLLQLRADSTMPLWTSLAPGESMQWLVEASLTDTDHGTLALELRSGGALVNSAGLIAEVVSCDREFTLDGTKAPRCEGVSRAELRPTPLARVSTMDRGTLYSLAHLERERSRHLLVTLSLPRSADVAEGAHAVVGLGLHAAGDSASPEPPGPGTPPGASAPPASPRGPLAMTGEDLLPLLLLAAGLVGLGTIALIRRRADAAAPPGGRA